jgi:hypothetical protein
MPLRLIAYADRSPIGYAPCPGDRRSAVRWRGQGLGPRSERDTCRADTLDLVNNSRGPCFISSKSVLTEQFGRSLLASQDLGCLSEMIHLVACNSTSKLTAMEGLANHQVVRYSSQIRRSKIDTVMRVSETNCFSRLATT